MEGSWGCKNQLVGLELETILAGQGDIREVRVGLKLSEDKGPKLGPKLRHTLHLCQSANSKVVNVNVYLY